MVLKPLEFSDCLSDSPWFRQNLREHENSLENSYKTIKLLESQCKELISAAHKLSATQRAFAKTLREFKFESIATTQTDEERVIASCVKEFSRLITQVEDQRDRILEEAEKIYIEPLKKFRTERIGRALHDDKKKFEKSSSKFYTSLEKHLHLSTAKKNDFKELDASLELEQRSFFQASLDYVYVLQSVQERMKFEFFETLSSFLYSWLTFYHVGHVIHEDFKPYLDGAQIKVQKAKESFDSTQKEAEELKSKMLQIRAISNPTEVTIMNSSVKQGYLFLLEKKNLVTAWTKYYCVFQKETRIFTMIPFSQTAKMDVKGTFAHSISMKLKSCTRRASDSIDKRFCFDLCTDRSPEVLTFQAVSDEDRRSWISVMDGREPVYSPSACPTKTFETVLNECGFEFMRMCLKQIEKIGLEEQGLYRNCGVNSKVQKLIQMGLDRRKMEKLNLYDDKEWELRTVSSGVKTFLRNLPEPLMTFDLHNKFINAAKLDSVSERVNHVHFYVHQLPADHFRMLELVVRHLKLVADNKDKNLMSVANLGVCFGPTLLRPREESLAAIMDIKFCNVVVEILINSCEKIFSTSPPPGGNQPRPPKPAHLLEAAKPAEYSSPAKSNNASREVTPTPLPRAKSTTPRSPGTIGHQGDHQTGFTSNVVRSRPVGIYYPADGCTVLQAGESCDSINSADSNATDSGSSKSPNVSQGSLTAARMSVSYAPPYPGELRRVRTLYECSAGHESELSFTPGQIITNVRESKEPHWLVGTLNGKTGLIPDNYVEPLP